MVTLHSLARELPPLKVWVASKMRRKIGYIQANFPNVKIRIVIGQTNHEWYGLREKHTMYVRTGNRWVSPTTILPYNWTWGAPYYYGSGEITSDANLLIEYSKSYQR